MSPLWIYIIAEQIAKKLVNNDNDKQNETDSTIKEQYTINEILIAIDDLQNSKKERKIDTIVINKSVSKKKSDIPSNTLKLIEEAEKTIRSKLQSE